MNNKFEGDYVLLKNDNITQTARAFEREFINDFIKEQCASTPIIISSINLCEGEVYTKRMLAKDFITSKKSPLFHGGCLNDSRKKCWREKRREFGSLLKEMNRDEKYAALVKIAWFSSAVKQLFLFEQEQLYKVKYKAIIKKYYPDDFIQFKSSVQSKRRIDFQGSNLIEAIVVLTCFFYLLFASVAKQGKFITYFITLFGILVLNAFLLGYYQSASAPLQGRIVSIVSLGVIILFFNSPFFKQFIAKLSEFRIKD